MEQLGFQAMITGGTIGVVFKALHDALHELKKTGIVASHRLAAPAATWASTGIRPKTVPKGAPGQDFVVQGPQAHGVPGLINLFGIESPGLTASLAIADHVLEVSRTEA